MPPRPDGDGASDPAAHAEPRLHADGSPAIDAGAQGEPGSGVSGGLEGARAAGLAAPALAPANAGADAAPKSDAGHPVPQGADGEEGLDTEEGHGSLAPEGGATARVAVDDPTPEVIAELAASCSDYVFAALGVRLDFTPETLPLLDHYLVGARQEIAQQPALLPLVSRAAGAYFGEVLRRLAGGFWVVPSADDTRWCVCGRRVFFAINPVGVVHDALAGTSEHAGPSGALQVSRDEREAIERRLAQAPPLPADQYFLLSSRLEALDIVCEALHASLDGPGGALYEAEDYAELLPT